MTEDKGSDRGAGPLSDPSTTIVGYGCTIRGGAIGMREQALTRNDDTQTCQEENGESSRRKFYIVGIRDVQSSNDTHKSIYYIEE